MAMPPHVADRMRKRRGRGGENATEGKGRVGEEEMEEEKKSVEERGRKMKEQRGKRENQEKTTFKASPTHAEPEM